MELFYCRYKSKVFGLFYFYDFNEVGWAVIDMNFVDSMLFDELWITDICGDQWLLMRSDDRQWLCEHSTTRVDEIVKVCVVKIDFIGNDAFACDKLTETTMIGPSNKLISSFKRIDVFCCFIITIAPCIRCGILFWEEGIEICEVVWCCLEKRDALHDHNEGKSNAVKECSFAFFDVGHNLMESKSCKKCIRDKKHNAVPDIYKDISEESTDEKDKRKCTEGINDRYEFFVAESLQEEEYPEYENKEKCHWCEWKDQVL